MKKKCDCYHTQQKTRYTYNQFTGSPIPHDVEVGVCWGTKETDECNCGGDETKCDFYPEVRVKAKKELKKQKEIESRVQVVRCKDCKHSKIIGSFGCVCNNAKTPWINDDFDVYMNQNDYCSYGEKRNSNK